MMNAQNTMIALDSLCANEFAVEIDGQRADGIFRVVGLILFRSSNESPQETPLTITKMVQRDPNTPFNQWLLETMNVAEISQRPKRTVSVIALDDGVETRRWTFVNAQIVAVTYSEFDSSSRELVEERISMHYGSVEHIWSQA